MYLTSNDVQNLTEEGLKLFLEKRISEAHHLDYKLDYPRDTNGGLAGNEAKREFLKDITAFANANGGDLVIGVDEPKDDIDVDAQLRGIDEPDKLVGIFERLARDCVDPSIPGLIVKVIRLTSGKGVIVVHVPPSITRPYRVNHSGHVNFFQRHTESIFAMNTHDIREAFFAAATAEAKAHKYLDEVARDVQNYDTEHHPALLVQAMPLISPEKPWDLMNDKVISVLRDEKGSRRKKFNHFSFESLTNPTRTLHGVMGRDDRTNPSFITHIHANGYISALDPQPLSEQKTQSHIYHTINRIHFQFFEAFAAFCTEILEATKTDSPYLLRCTLLSAGGVYLYAPEIAPRFHGPWRKPILQLPDQIRATGESFEKFAIFWSETLYHAFNLDLRLAT